MELVPRPLRARLEHQERGAVLYAQFLARPGMPLSHPGDGTTPSQRASAQGYQAGAFYAASAENIASGYPTAAQCFAGWMASPGHRDNILTDMAVPTANRRHMAVGVCIANGKTTAVQMFRVQQFLSDPSPTRTTTPARRRPTAPRRATPARF